MKSKDIRYHRIKPSSYRLPINHVIAFFAKTFESKTALLWPIFLYLLFGSLEKVGSIVAVGITITILATLVSGKLGDTGLKRALIKFTVVTSAIAGLARAFVSTVASAYLIGIVFNLFLSLKEPAYTASIYSHAKHYNAMRYIKINQLSSILSNALMWILVALLAPLIGSEFAIMSLFAVSALLSPLQLLILNPLKRKHQVVKAPNIVLSKNNL